MYSEVWHELEKRKIEMREKLDDVLRFDVNGDLTRFFMDGYCFHFANILMNMLPDGKIFYNQKYGHFVYYYGGTFWDITGEVMDKYYDESVISWDSLQKIDPLLSSRIIRDCIKKDKHI